MTLRSTTSNKYQRFFRALEPNPNDDYDLVYCKNRLHEVSEVFFEHDEFYPTSHSLNSVAQFVYHAKRFPSLAGLISTLIAEYAMSLENRQLIFLKFSEDYPSIDFSGEKFSISMSKTTDRSSLAKELLEDKELIKELKFRFLQTPIIWLGCVFSETLRFHHRNCSSVNDISSIDASIFQNYGVTDFGLYFDWFELENCKVFKSPATNWSMVNAHYLNANFNVIYGKLVAGSGNETVAFDPERISPKLSQSKFQARDQGDNTTEVTLNYFEPLQLP